MEWWPRRDRVRLQDVEYMRRWRAFQAIETIPPIQPAKVPPVKPLQAQRAPSPRFRRCA